MHNFVRRLSILDWNDLRHFLAVARTGSTLAASRRLAMSQATVSRRISALESALGARLFTRSASGYRLTVAGDAILPHAVAVETAVAGLTARSESETRRLTGAVRIATAEGAGNAWVIPAVAAFRQFHPEVRIELLASDIWQDFSPDEADILIRFGDPPRQETLIVRHLADMDSTIYAARTLVDQLGKPERYADLTRYPIVSFSGANGMTDWFERNAPGAQIVYSCNSMTGIIAAVGAGLGAGMGPSFLDRESSGLVALFPPIPELKTGAWLVTSETARQQPQVRAMIDYLVDHLVKNIRSLSAMV